MLDTKLTVLADLLDVGAAGLDEAVEVPWLGPAAVISHIGHPGCKLTSPSHSRNVIQTQPKHSYSEENGEYLVTSKYVYISVNVRFKLL